MKKKVKAEFTVEAVFLFPFIIFIIMALFYVAFYAHDAAVIQSCINKMVIREGQQLCHPTDISTGEVQYSMINQRSMFYLINYNKENEVKKIQTYVKNLLLKKLAITKIDSITGSMDKQKMEMTVDASLEVSFLPAKQYLKDFLKYRVVVKSEGYDPMKFSRIYDSVIDVSDDTKMYSSVKKYIQKVK